jgi:plastocyanin
VPSPRLLLAAGLVAASAAAAAGCGGGDEGTPAARPAEARYGVARTEADPRGGLIFTPADLTARAGRVTIDLRNPATSGNAHGIAVTGPGVNRVGSVVNPGRTSEIRARLKPGVYRLWCPARGHAMAGMTGLLRVR